MFSREQEIKYARTKIFLKLEISVWELLVINEEKMGFLLER